jgi:hypothetical protein
MPCGWLSLDWSFSQFRDGCPQGIEWLGLRRFKKALSKINLFFDTFCVTVTRSYKQRVTPNSYTPVNAAMTDDHVRMGRGGRGLPKVSTTPAVPDPSTPCRRVTPEMVLRMFQGWPACKEGGLQQSLTPLDTPRRTPMWKTEVLMSRSTFSIYSNHSVCSCPNAL